MSQLLLKSDASATDCANAAAANAFDTVASWPDRQSALSPPKKNSAVEKLSENFRPKMPKNYCSNNLNFGQIQT